MMSEKLENLKENIMFYFGNMCSSEKIINNNNLKIKNVDEMYDILAEGEEEWKSSECDSEGPTPEQNLILDMILEKTARKILELNNIGFNEAASFQTQKLKIITKKQLSRWIDIYKLFDGGCIIPSIILSEKWEGQEWMYVSTFKNILKEKEERLNESSNPEKEFGVYDNYWKSITISHIGLHYVTNWMDVVIDNDGEIFLIKKEKITKENAKNIFEKIQKERDESKPSWNTMAYSNMFSLFEDSPEPAQSSE